MNKMSSSNDAEDPWCDPANPRIVDFEQISAAAYKIRDGIVRTPCDVSIISQIKLILFHEFIRLFQPSHMSEEAEMTIYLKKEYMQYTGSFKERGARYTLLMLDEAQKRKGVIAASAGNHAQAMAYHGGQLGSLKTAQT